MKVKFFENPSAYSFSDFENEINEFINQEKIEIVSITQTVTPMHDLWEDGRICNQWNQFIVILIYKEL